MFKKMKNRISALTLMATSVMLMASGSCFAFGEDVSINSKGAADADVLMGKVIGILLSITRYVGVALAVYGVYEIVMSFMQNQPEAKTKGIVMALAGVVMISLKSILVAIGIVA